MSIRTIKGVLIGASLLASAWASAAAGAEKIVFCIPGAPWSAQFAHVYFGEKLGFFREEGMDPIERISVSGTAIALPQVATGQVHFSSANADLPIIALSKGEPLPVKFVYNNYRSQTFEFVTLANSPITQLSDLKGRKIGVGALTWGNLPMSRAMLASVGITWNKDIEALPVGVGPAAWRRLQTGEIDALNLFVTEHGRMELAGIPIKRIALPQQFRRIFSNGYLTSDAMIKDRPKLVEGFGRAIAKSWLACKSNPEACVRAYWEMTPAARPAPDREAAQLASDMKQALFDAVNLDDFAEGEPVLYGHYPDGAFQRFGAVMKQEGQIPREDLDYSKVYTGSFAEAFNAFDKQKVIDVAKAAK